MDKNVNQNYEFIHLYIFNYEYIIVNSTPYDLIPNDDKLNDFNPNDGNFGSVIGIHNNEMIDVNYIINNNGSILSPNNTTVNKRLLYNN